MGTIFEVGAASAKAVFSGPGYDTAQVGGFVAVDCRRCVLFGRLSGVYRTPTSASDSPDGEATFAIDLLTTIALDGQDSLRGIERFPHLGARVYAAPPILLRWLFECSQLDTVEENGHGPVILNLLSLGDGTQVGLAPERVFGRHCAVLGATGVGKSWTLARLVEESARYSAKIILFDPTGEFHSLDDAGIRHVHIGADLSRQEPSKEVAMPYYALTESDLLALFKPRGPTQAPKLRAAMKSLKLARVPQLSIDGVVIKVGRLKHPYQAAYKARALEVEGPEANFDISKLAAQINAECVFPTGGFASNPDPSRWGGPNEVELSNCVNLVTRIEDMLHAPELACVFQPGKMRTIFDEIQTFIEDPTLHVLRISLKYLPVAHDAREIVANALGRHLLELARSGKLHNRPLLLFLDEAHNFLRRTLADEDATYPMDAFELIAKEGRKISLNFCIATQRPRDIPEGILSQIGTFIVHRLNNDLDQTAVGSASSDADRSVLAFVPSLGEGQAIIIGADLPLPLVVQILKPVQQPDSRGPDYQKYWRHHAAV